MTTQNIQWFNRVMLDRVIVDRIQPVDVVLDIGCGIRPQTFFRPRLHICCEPHPEYVKVLQNRFAGFPDVVILQETAQEVVKMMPDKSVDSVFLMDVIEHLEKEDGRCLVLECERIARRQIVVFTPLGFMPQEYEPGDEDAWGYRGGEWQAHKSGWTPDDFGQGWDILGSRAYHTVNAKGETIDSPFGAFWAIRRKEAIVSPVKFAVLSHVLPPSPSGQSMVLYRLLRDVRPDDYCLLSREHYDPYAGGQHLGPRLPARYHHLLPGFILKRPNRFGLRAVRKLVNGVIGVLHRARIIERIVKQEKCSVIIACTGDQYDLPAAYLASRWARVPFYAHLFDDYAYQWTKPISRRLAQWVEPIVLKGATGVIVPNEFLRDEYQCRYQIEAAIVRNPCEISAMGDGDGFPWPEYPDEIRIIYTGAVYQANYDAFRNLVAAIRQLARPDINLHLYTAQPRAELDQEGIGRSIVYHDHLPSSDVWKVQQRADMLFLPLAFDSPYPEVIKTSAPGKMGEYLASGRPILVHAPADSYVSWYFKEHQCGVVVDRNEPAVLAEAIRRIIDDQDLRKKYGENARARARADFSVEAARAKFLKLFQPTDGG